MPELFDHPYASLLARVEKPSRYTGAEHGSRFRQPSSDGPRGEAVLKGQCLNARPGVVLGA